MSDIPELIKSFGKRYSEAYLQGVSTRKIQDIVAHLGVEKISPSYVSKNAAELDQSPHLFLSKPIETYIPYFFIDASHFNLRDRIQYTNKAFLVIAWIRNDGFREILASRISRNSLSRIPAIVQSTT